MQATADSDKKRALALKVAEQREKIYAWNQRASAPLSQCCESIADDNRIEFLTSCMVRNEDGSKVWSDYDSFVKEKNQALAIQARYSTMLYLQGLDDNFFDNLPENQVLRELAEQDVVDEETIITDAGLEEAEIIEEVEEKPKVAKKRAKK